MFLNLKLASHIAHKPLEPGLMYMGFMWSLFLIGHMYVCVYIATLEDMNGGHKTCGLMGLDYVLNI